CWRRRCCWSPAACSRSVRTRGVGGVNQPRDPSRGRTQGENMIKKRAMVASVAVLALVGAACGGDDDDAAEPAEPADAGGDEPAGDEPAGDEPAPDGVDCAVDEVDGDLFLYNWAEYIDPELLSAFEDQYG